MTIEDAPLTPSAVLALLALVEDDPGWPRKRRIVALIGSFEGGIRIPAEEIGRWCGLSDGRTRVLLRELEAARVLIRWGDRRTWLEVNPAFGDWDVRWSLAGGDLVGRLAWHAQTTDQSLAERIIGCSMSNRYGRIIGRSIATDRGAQRAKNRAVNEQPINAQITPLSRAYRATDNRARTARPWSNRKNGASPKRGTPSSRELCEPESSSSASPDGEEQEPMVSDDDMARAQRAILRVAGTGKRGEKYLRGPAWHQTKAIVRLHGIVALEDAAALVPAGQMLVPDVVNWIHAHIDQPPRDDTAILEQAEQTMRTQLRAKLLERLAELNEELAFHTLQTDDQDMVEWCRDRIKECENELAQLTGAEEDQ